MKLLSYLFFAFLMAVISYDSGEEDKTVVFREYLNSIFDEAIPEDTHYYVIINLVGCNGCVKREISLTNRISQKYKDNTTVIVCFHSKNPPSKIKHIKNKRILKDRFSKFFRINVHPEGSAIIKTVNRKIEWVNKLNSNILEKDNN
jgi:hypothetical protein